MVLFWGTDLVLATQGLLESIKWYAKAQLFSNYAKYSNSRQSLLIYLKLFMKMYTSGWVWNDPQACRFTSPDTRTPSPLPPPHVLPSCLASTRVQGDTASPLPPSPQTPPPHTSFPLHLPPAGAASPGWPRAAAQEGGTADTATANDNENYNGNDKDNDNGNDNDNDNATLLTIALARTLYVHRH